MAQAERYDPTRFFGQPAGAYSGNPFQAGSPSQWGTGATGLPKTFFGWNASARYAVPFSLDYQRRSAPITQFFRQEMGKDYQGELMGLSKDITETNLSEGSRAQGQAFTRAGLSSGAGVSPVGAMQLQMESAARSGALGMAARQAVLQAQAMKLGVAQGYQNHLANLYQAMLVPAYLQQGAHGAPVGPVGPSMVGPAYQFGTGAGSY